MIVGIGVDVVNLDRFADTLQRTPSVRQRIFRPSEAELPLESLAARFAAKEAFVKAIRSPSGIVWNDIEVVNDADGIPDLALHGAAAEQAESKGVRKVHVSLSHDTSVATAFVVAEA